MDLNLQTTDALKVGSWYATDWTGALGVLVDGEETCYGEQWCCLGSDCLACQEKASVATHNVSGIEFWILFVVSCAPARIVVVSRDNHFWIEESEAVDRVAAFSWKIEERQSIAAIDDSGHRQDYGFWSSDRNLGCNLPHNGCQDVDAVRSRDTGMSTSSRSRDAGKVGEGILDPRRAQNR